MSTCLVPMLRDTAWTPELGRQQAVGWKDASGAMPVQPNGLLHFGKHLLRREVLDVPRQLRQGPLVQQPGEIASVRWRGDSASKDILTLIDEALVMLRFSVEPQDEVQNPPAGTPISGSGGIFQQGPKRRTGVNELPSLEVMAELRKPIQKDATPGTHGVWCESGRAANRRRLDDLPER